MEFEDAASKQSGQLQILPEADHCATARVNRIGGFIASEIAPLFRGQRFELGFGAQHAPSPSTAAASLLQSVAP